jgi:hypothetical protein
MKRLAAVVMVVASVAVLGGCSMFKRERISLREEPAKVAQQEPQLLDANGAPIERVPFRPGTSSVTVENLAKKVGCTGGEGAGLMTAPGPVEVYRMVCDNRSVFMAKCELRQCRAM